MLLFSDKCASNPCLYGGTCEVVNEKINCKCPPKFQGERCESRPKDYCTAINCNGNGRCVEDYDNNGAMCICKFGYTSGKRFYSLRRNH